MGHKSSNNFFAMRASPGPSLGGALPRVAREPVENRRRSVFSLNSFFVHRDMLSGEWRKAQEKGRTSSGEPPAIVVFSGLSLGVPRCRQKDEYFNQASTMSFPRKTQ